MKKTVFFFVSVLIIALLCGGCGRSTEMTYAPYVELPDVQPTGTITFGNLSEITALQRADDGDMLFVSEDYFWTRNIESNVARISLTTKQWQTIGEMNFGTTMDQFTRTQDGAVWGSYSVYRTAETENAVLVRFDEEEGTFSEEYEWPDSSAFIKLLGYENDLYISRVVTVDDGKRYVLEKYRPKTQRMTSLVEMTFQDGIGSTIYGMSVDESSLFALISERESAEKRTFYIVRYDLNGRELERYEMPEYNDDFIAIHKSPMDIEVFDGIVAIDSIQSNCTIFQLQDGCAKKIHLQGNPQEALTVGNEKPAFLPFVRNTAVADRFTFFKIKGDIVCYDREKSAFRRIEVEMEEAYVIGINSNLDVFFEETTSADNAGYTVPKTIYMCNLKSLLLDE